MPALRVITIAAADSPYTAAAYTTILCNCVAGAITVNLPAAAGAADRYYDVKKIDAGQNAVTVDGNGTETIDGSLTVKINTQWASVSMRSDGSNWYIK